MQYLDFLKALLALGPKLPEVFSRVQRIIAEVMELVAIVRGPSPNDGGLEHVGYTEALVDGKPVTAEILDAEREVLALTTGAGEGSEALFDGTALRRLFAFAAANPQLLALLVSLLKGGA